MSMVSIVIPNYKGKKLIEKNLDQVLHRVSGHEVIVVDDGSKDGSVEFIKKNYPQVRLIEKVTNSGFATAVNLGIKAARGEVVFLLNTDAVPEKDFLKFVLPHFSDSQVFAVGSLDKSIEKDKVVKRGRGIGRYRRGFLVHSRGDIDKTNTLWASGGSSAFSKSIWEQLGGMDEVYNPFYWEDIDLSYRALKAGYKLVFEPKSIIVHNHSEGSIRAHYTDLDIKRISYRNQFIFVWKNVTDIGKLIEHLLWLPYHKIRALMRGDLEFFYGLLLALIKLPTIIRKRRAQFNTYKKRDGEIINRFNE